MSFTKDHRSDCCTYQSTFLLVIFCTALSFLFPVPAKAQSVPSWAGNLLLEHSTITADPTMTAPEAQGLGHKFELLFAMMNDHDPQNSDNDTISLVATPSAIGVAVRDMLPGAKVESLTNMLSLKYFFVGSRTCNGGSPRVQLFINPGDGTPARNAFGYVGDKPFGGACVPNMWVYEDMTDAAPKWDLSQFAPLSNAFCTGGNSMICTWQQVVTFFDTVYPNHEVLSGGVYDDSCSFDTLACGKAYYDLVTVENRTLENKEDTVQGPTH